MGEIERRRRRLRPATSAAPVPAPPPAGPPPVAPADDSMTPTTVTPTTVTPTAVTPTTVTPTTVTPTTVTPTTVTPTAEDPVRPVFPARPPRGRPTSGAGAGGDDREAERGLRGLVGSGSSQVSVGAALRARDAARPTDAQIADAEANLMIVHRNWMPREDLPRKS